MIMQDTSPDERLKVERWGGINLFIFTARIQIRSEVEVTSVPRLTCCLA